MLRRQESPLKQRWSQRTFHGWREDGAAWLLNCSNVQLKPLNAWGNVAVDFLSGRLTVDGRIFAQMQRRVGRVSSLWTRIELVPAPVVEHIASTLAVFAAPAPVMEHISCSCSNRGTCAGDGIRRTNSCSDRSTCVSTATARALIAHVRQR